MLQDVGTARNTSNATRDGPSRGLSVSGGRRDLVSPYLLLCSLLYDRYVEGDWCSNSSNLEVDPITADESRFS